MVYEGFLELSTCRPRVPGVLCEIPWIVISHYADRLGLDEEAEFGHFVYCVRELDRTFLAYYKDKNDKPGSTSGKNA